MIPFLIGAVVAFKWMYEKGVLKPSPRKGLPAPKTTPQGSKNASGVGVGEDYYPPEQMRRPAKQKSQEKAPTAPPAREKAQEPLGKRKDDKKLLLPTRDGGIGSFDDVMEDPDSDPGVGEDEFEELREQGYDKGEQEDEEA